MSTVARSRSRYQGNQFGRCKARSVNLCTAVFSLALADSVLSVQIGNVTSTSYVGRHFEVRGLDQPTKYVFNGATRVAAITGSLSANTRIQRLRLWPGWNLASLWPSPPPTRSISSIPSPPLGAMATGRWFPQPTSGIQPPAITHR
jgi:hypothetical protein